MAPEMLRVQVPSHKRSGRGKIPPRDVPGSLSGAGNLQVSPWLPGMQLLPQHSPPESHC